MNETKMYDAGQICKLLKISSWTLANWYNWERKMLKEGIVDKPYLPHPVKMEHEKGRPRLWTEQDLKDLRTFQKSIVTGRNGTFGIYSNPAHKETMKYKKQMEALKNE